MNCSLYRSMHTLRALACGLISLLALTAARAADDLPAHPDEIRFPPLGFTLPEPEQHRHVLSNGVVVFLAPSTELPLIDLQVRCRGGEYLDPAGKDGLYGAMGSMMRRGGTTEMPAEAFDDRLDFLAAQVSSGCDTYFYAASLDSLKSNFDESAGLFFQMLRNPGFQEDRWRTYQSEALEGMKQRNDNADSILRREWSALIYGREHFRGRVMTQSSLQSITRDDLLAAHRAIVHPGAMVVGVTGDFVPAAMLAMLESLFADWEAGAPPAAPPDTQHQVAGGIYHVEKDIPQGKVFIGMRGIQLDDPDLITLEVMDEILGSGGFTSRIVRRVRSDEGLAYSAGSRMTPGLYFPGEFRALFQSKNDTVALATKLIFEELTKIRTEPVTDQELQVAKNALIESFPARFGTKRTNVSQFIDEELRGRSWDHWRKYRDRVAAVTAADITQAAGKHLQPDRMAVLVVGPWDKIASGDLAGRASMEEFHDGKVTHLPLRDPLTQEPIRPE